MARTMRFCHFLQKHYGRTDGPTDGPTDGRMDTPSYRDARTHLKTILMKISKISTYFKVNFGGTPTATETILAKITLKLDENLENLH